MEFLGTATCSSTAHRAHCFSLLQASQFLIDGGSLRVCTPAHVDERYHTKQADSIIRLQQDCCNESWVERGRHGDFEKCLTRDLFSRKIEDLQLRRPYPRT